MLSGEILTLFERYEEQIQLYDQDDKDLLEEIYVKLKRLIKRHEQIKKLNEEILTKNLSEIIPEGIEELALKVAQKHFPKGFKHQIRSISSAHGTDMNQATDRELALEEMVRMSYGDMFRIIEICRKAKENLQLNFEANGVSITYNKLIKHAGTKSDSPVTRDSFVVSSEGPIIKGSRRSDQASELKGFGIYFKEYEEFMSNLSVKIQKKLH